MTTVVPPPPFEEQLTDDTRAPHESQIQNSLPDYSPRVAHASRPAEEREFEYKVEKKKGETLASLKVLAPAAYSKSIPTFCGAGPVKGSVNLYLDEPDTITSVVVSVRGRLMFGHCDSDNVDLNNFTLFEISDTLWSKDADEIATNPLLSNKKLLGTHSWPFAFSIPEQVQFPAGGTGSSTQSTTQYCIPQSFTERTLSSTIQYEVIVQVRRGRFKSDYNIHCTFGYFPITRPPPYPALKTISYQERTPLLDPAVDVDGWITAKKVKISGTLFNSHSAVVDCQLFISAPLAYTRGSVIPLYVCLQSSNQHAVDLLATHKALQVRLERRIQYPLPMSSIKNTGSYHKETNRRNLAEAVWWPTTSQEQRTLTPATTGTAIHTVCLNGEIHLRGDLAPSTTFPPFSIEYYVCLSASSSSGFKTVDVDKDLLAHPVDIVTSFASGPRAIRYAPPGYESEKPLPMEFGVALGALGYAFG